MEDTATAAPDRAQPASRPARLARGVGARLPRQVPGSPYSVTGAAMSLLFAGAAFTPSLLPRGWLAQGVVDGLSAACGYGVGVVLAWLTHAVTGWEVPQRARGRVWLGVVVIGGPLLGLMMWRGQQWQQEVHRLAGVPAPDSNAWAAVLAVTAVVFWVVISVGRGFRWLVRQVSRRLLSRLPQRLAGPLAVVLVTTLLVLVNDGLLWRLVVNAANSSFGAFNETSAEGSQPPAALERSGSPASLASWASLGRKGRDFVAGGPDVADLTEFSGEPARTPIRVYIGLDSAGSARDRASMAVAELRRTGAFDRDVLVVTVTTGTGWVDPSSVAAVEYLHNGDSAVVAVQYSYLPSWISVLVDAEKASEAGQELFTQVHEAWEALPVDERPRLLVTGTSLGATGSEAAFSGVADLRNRTDGVVWAGPPAFTALHSDLVEQRDTGSPAHLPVVDDGRIVRFASTAEDLWAPGRRWERPRVVYLQNGSDPVVYWSPRLLLDRPDWLEEQTSPQVSPDMVWLPVVTFWQVTMDLPSTVDLPPGHGHIYDEIFADAWAAVAAPQDWTADDTERLRQQLAGS